MHTPLIDAVTHIVGDAPARFFVPGHKGNAAESALFGGVFSRDITEIPGADDLSHPTGPIRESQENMARAYGSGATLYSAFGSTSCILAMLALFTTPGQTIVMARGCHAAAVRGLALLGLAPNWVWPKAAQPTAGEVETALRGSGAGAVYLTSPDYYGNMADIRAIAAVCRARGAKLLVDNAHGAHLRFFKEDLHPLSLGADATCDSAHKTLPCLTPAALLHLRDASLADAARSALNLFSSTSPSYLVLQSLDHAASLLLEHRLDFNAAAARFATALAQSGHLLQEGGDPLKACLRPARGGWEAEEVDAALTEAGVIPELSDGTHIVLMASPCNTGEDFDRLAQALRRFTHRTALPTETPVLRPPEAALPVRDALFAAKETLPVAQTEGRICAGIAAPCPPGVPLLVPGERIAPGMPQMLARGGISHLDVVK